MRSSLRSRLVCAAGSVVILAAAREAAAEAPTPARVRVDAPSDCATTTSFWSALSRRTDRLRAAEPSESAATIDVTIRRDDARVRGELHVARAGERASTRKLGGASCGEVTDGLSLVAALAFDPSARVDRGSEIAPPPVASDTPPPPPPPAPATAPASPSVEEPSQAGSPAGSPAAPAERAFDPRAARSPWRIGLGAGAGALGLSAPSATLGYGGFLDLELDRAGFAPSFRLGVGLSRGRDDASSSAANGAAADLSWIFARVAVCPYRLDAGSLLNVRPCAAVDAGTLSADPRGAPSSQARTRPWIAPGVAARITWTPSRLVFVEGQLGALFPLVRDELVIDPSVTLYRAPVAVPSAEIAAGFRFP